MRTYILFDSPIVERPLYIMTDDEVFAALLWEGYAPFVKIGMAEYIFEKKMRFLSVRIVGDLRLLHTDDSQTKKLVKPARLSHLLFLFVSKNLVLKDHIYFMHGALISCKRRGIVLTGESGAGKSTLCAYLKLAKEQFICSTDDKTLIDCEDLSIHSVGDGIHLREDSLAILHTYYDKFQVESVSLYRYKREKIKADEWDGSALSVVVQIERTKGESRYQCLGVRDTVKALLRDGFISSDIGKNIAAVFALSKKIPVFQMQYQDLADAKEMLIKIAEES